MVINNRDQFGYSRAELGKVVSGVVQCGMAQLGKAGIYPAIIIDFGARCCAVWCGRVRCCEVNRGLARCVLARQGRIYPAIIVIIYDLGQARWGRVK